MFASTYRNYGYNTNKILNEDLKLCQSCSELTLCGLVGGYQAGIGGSVFLQNPDNHVHDHNVMIQKTTSDIFTTMRTTDL